MYIIKLNGTVQIKTSSSDEYDYLLIKWAVL